MRHPNEANEALWKFLSVASPSDEAGVCREPPTQQLSLVRGFHFWDFLVDKITMLGHGF